MVINMPLNYFFIAWWKEIYFRRAVAFDYEQTYFNKIKVFIKLLLGRPEHSVILTHVH